MAGSLRKGVNPIVLAAVFLLIIGLAVIGILKFQEFVGPIEINEMSSDQRCKGTKLEIDHVWIDGENNVLFILKNSGSISLKPSEWKAITVTGGVEGKQSTIIITTTLINHDNNSDCTIPLNDSANWDIGQLYKVTCIGWGNVSGLKKNDIYSITVKPACGYLATKSVTLANLSSSSSTTTTTIPEPASTPNSSDAVAAITPADNQTLQQQQLQQSDSEKRCAGIRLSVDQVWIDNNGSDVSFTLQNSGIYNLKPDEWSGINVTGGVAGKKSTSFTRGLNVTGRVNGCTIPLDGSANLSSDYSYKVTCHGWKPADIEEHDVYFVTVSPPCGAGATNSVVYSRPSGPVNQQASARCKGIRLAIDEVWIDVGNVSFTLRNSGSISLKPNEWEEITVTGSVAGKSTSFCNSLSAVNDNFSCYVVGGGLNETSEWAIGISYEVTCPNWGAVASIAENDVYAVTVRPPCGAQGTNSVVYTAVG